MKKENPTYQPSSPAVAARVFAAAAEETVADLERRLPTGMEPLQRALAARIRHATTQLLACANQRDTDELMMLGSTGQRIPHPFLKTEQALRKEMSDGLKELAFRTEQAAMFREAQALSRRPSQETPAGGGEK